LAFGGGAVVIAPCLGFFFGGAGCRHPQRDDGGRWGRANHGGVLSVSGQWGRPD
jgi:hypothetical protein